MKHFSAAKNIIDKSILISAFGQYLDMLADRGTADIEVPCHRVHIQ
jgi:hypothetical protein